MRIGEASSASGVPERMIRHYEKLGLIPAPARRASGYRVYSDDDVRRLRFIATARHLGFAMSEIAEAMQASGDGSMADVAMRWRLKIASKSDALAILGADLESMASGRDRP